jgi:hypothetical protein
MFKEIETSRVKYFEMFPNHALDINGLAAVMIRNTTVSFNGLSYDLPIIQATLEGFDNKALKKLSDRIVKSKIPSWQICKNNNIHVPLHKWDHIDLINVAPGVASLKLYGGRMGCKKMQDLPISPKSLISPEQQIELRRYCENDLDLTILLYEKLQPQLDLRKTMSKQYGIDLRSKSDPQIAETIIKKELEIKTHRKYRPLKLKEGATISYTDPKIVTFQNPELKTIFNFLLKCKFQLAGNGSIKLPKELKNNTVKINEREYKIGIGGLHSCEKSQLIQVVKDEILCEQDVSSYYPNIISQQKLAPNSMGNDFLELYQTIIDERLKAKAINDKTTADTKKLMLNGSFGKLGSKYSPLYAPALLLQTTLTGQLCLLMLIERMEQAGIKIKSANTDGIVCQCSKNQERAMEEIVWDWELDTTYNLERTNYRLIASRDVNNYFAIESTGKVKRKGIFNTGSLQKNPDRNIIYTAVIQFLKDNIPIKQTIHDCTDPNEFITARKVTGGAMWNGKLIGKAIRYYSSTKAKDIDPYIRYALNNNKVPKSDNCRPLMEMGETIPNDLDYASYIADARKLLKLVGHA